MISQSRPPAVTAHHPAQSAVAALLACRGCAKLLDKARNLKINLSRTLEERLAQLVREAEAEEWLAANRKAIDAYNARVERDGVWSDKVRGF